MTLRHLTVSRANIQIPQTDSSQLGFYPNMLVLFCFQREGERTTTTTTTTEVARGVCCLPFGTSHENATDSTLRE